MKNLIEKLDNKGIFPLHDVHFWFDSTNPGFYVDKGKEIVANHILSLAKKKYNSWLKYLEKIIDLGQKNSKYKDAIDKAEKADKNFALLITTGLAKHWVNTKAGIEDALLSFWKI